MTQSAKRPPGASCAKDRRWPFHDTELTRYDVCLLGLEAGMRRRDFIAGLGGAVAWSSVAHAREPRIAVLMNFTEKTGQPLLAVLLEELRRLGWVDRETARIDIRWGAGDAERIRKGIAELMALAPDIIVTTSTPPTSMFREATRTIPIVFGSIVDPVGSGIVESLSQPGGNVTGFTNYEYSIGPKCQTRL